MKVLISLLVAVASLTSSARADKPGVHGMLLFGNGVTYASHLPMFHAPHNRQLIIKVSLQEGHASKGLAAYQEAKKQGKTLFTLEPEVLDLEKISNGTKSNFIASVYDGHFEQGGVNLGKIQVHVEKIILSALLTQMPAADPSLTTSPYLIFGEGEAQGQYFAAHLIQTKPSFDAILEVSQPYKLKPQSVGCHGRACSEILAAVIPDASLPLTLEGPALAQALTAPTDDSALFLGGNTHPITDVLNVLYVESADLAM